MVVDSSGRVQTATEEVARPGIQAPSSVQATNCRPVSMGAIGAYVQYQHST